MSEEPGPQMTSGRRGRIEVKTVLMIVSVIIVVGAIWVAVAGSPTRNRAAIDSSSNTAPTIGANSPRLPSPQAQRQ